MTKQKILLVDDEPRVTRLLRLHIEETGAYEVKEVNEGCKVLTVARQFMPDFILLDVVMPDMDGGEVASQVAADEKLKNIPIVFLTATVTKGEERVIAGHPFLAKPAKGEQVIDCIQQHLGPISSEPTGEASNSSGFIGLRHFAIVFLIIFLLGTGYLGYRQHNQTEESQREPAKELQKTRNELSSLPSSAAHTIQMQNKIIDDRGKTWAERNDSFRKLNAFEASLEKTLVNMEESRISSLKSSGVSLSLLNRLAPSTVKLYCLANSHSDDVQMGSGFLFRSSNENTGLPFYYVQTNLQVIQMADRPTSECRILLYPDYTDRKSYYLFKSRGYKSYGEDIDIAFVEPEIVNDLKSGTRNELVIYARDEVETQVCDSLNIGDHLSILGYPSIGGETLTVTKGIISGFELGERSRYIKTSAKTDRGNSGGVAIKDSGCLVGIPTFSRRGRAESIGRILDLNYLNNETRKYITLK